VSKVGRVMSALPPKADITEAKTENDIDTMHTRAQLSVFGFTRMRQSVDRCPLYISIPRSAAYRLDRVLADLGLIGAKHVIRLHIPDALISGEHRHAA
jgi:hypothetical protein